MNTLDNDIVTVSKIQIALDAGTPTLQAELTELSLNAHTETPEGLWELLQSVIQILLKNTEYWTHVLASSQTVSTREEGENLFEKLSLNERSKFSVETLTNIEGKISQNQTTIEPVEGVPAYIVVTLLLGTADDQPLFTTIDSIQTLSEILHHIQLMSADYLMVFELLWSPQSASDSLTKEEMMTKYADMIPIFQ
jgi:uncharacterized membrane protein